MRAKNWSGHHDIAGFDAERTKITGELYAGVHKYGSAAFQERAHVGAH
jgi:hypothetical protein